VSVRVPIHPVTEYLFQPIVKIGRELRLAITTVRTRTPWASRKFIEKIPDSDDVKNVDLTKVHYFYLQGLLMLMEVSDTQKGP
jgi:hypothetical protein